MKKRRKKTDINENAGKYILDISKLIFGAIFLSSILRIGLPNDILLLGGFITAILLCVGGLKLTAKQKEEENND